MKSIDQIREAAKALRNGEKLIGFTYTKSAETGIEVVHVEEDNKSYKISGTFRISVTEYDPNAPAPDPKADKPKREKKAKEPTYRLNTKGQKVCYVDPTCTKCGKTFERSIYTKSTQCPECSGTANRGKAQRDANGKIITTVYRVCTKCGKTFKASIYNPKVTECPDCRPKASKSREHAQPKKLICAKCGKEFEVSKFQPYWTPEMGCPDCRDQIRKDRNKAKRAEKAKANPPSKA